MPSYNTSITFGCWREVHVQEVWQEENRGLSIVVLTVFVQVLFDRIRFHDYYNRGFM